MAVQAIKDYLDSHHVNYNCISHQPAFTAQELAQSAHVSGKEVAKTVIVKISGKLAMVVVPANQYVNFASLKKCIGQDDIELASENEFRDAFPGCEIGAMPPFGNLYDMPVYLSEELAKDERIAFNAGDYSELIQLDFDDYEELVHPRHVELDH